MFDNSHNCGLDSKNEIASASDILCSGLIGIYIMSTTELVYLFTWETATKLFWAFGVWAASLIVKTVSTEIYNSIKPQISKYVKCKLVKLKFIKNVRKRKKAA